MRLTIYAVLAVSSTSLVRACPGCDGSSGGPTPPGLEDGSCAPADWTSPVPSDPSGDFAFSMVFASDSQLPWYQQLSDCDSDCVKAFGESTNRDHVAAMNDIASIGAWPDGSTVAAAEGVVLNGDLTAFWHPWQVELWRKYYDAGYGDAHADVLQLPLYPGLGNHDYANNVGDCWGDDPVKWLVTGADTCATDAVTYMAETVTCGTADYFRWEDLHSFDADSLAYSWDIGGWHFVQLHNYPTYDEPDIDISPSIAWLERDLADATAAGMKIVLNMHDFGDHWSTSDAGFLDALEDSSVVAVFAGHIHSHVGYRSTVPGTDIPWFRSGAAEYNTMLLVEFRPEELVVGTVSTHGGVGVLGATSTWPVDLAP